MGNNTAKMLAMPATYLGVITKYCAGCAASSSSVVLVSKDGGNSWAPASTRAYMSGISQFVALKNGSLLALGRGGSNFPDPKCPWLTRSISHDRGVSWEHGWYEGLWPLGGGKRMVLFRLTEGPLILISFTGASNKDVRCHFFVDWRSGGHKCPILPLTGEISYLCFTGSQKYF